MKKTKVVIVLFLIFILTSGFVYLRIANPFADSGRYKFLFRRTLYSNEANPYPARKHIYELAPVIRGKVYKPNYFFLPEQNQYLVRSSLEFQQISRWDNYAPERKEPVKRHVLLDEKGKELRSLDTDVNFSRYSGLFFDVTYYMDWLQTGSCTPIPYDTIYNQDLSMTQEVFVEHFRKLHEKADNLEYVNLRTKLNDKYGAGVVFKILGKWHILLSGVKDSRMSRKYMETDERTAIWDEDMYRVSFDYNDTAYKQKDPYPPSPASMQIIPLETDMPDPYNFNRTNTIVGDRELVMDKYIKENSTGWVGIGKAKGVPVYVPGMNYGIAYMRLNLGQSTIRFKIPDVEKSNFLPVYNLGVRLFKIPKKLRTDSSLVFLESTQNGREVRPGGGVYVVRRRAGENFPKLSSDLPEGVSEERFSQLPLTLQQALMDIEGAVELSIESANQLEWFPEIELLKNLTYFQIRTGLTEIPDGIGKLQKLKLLILEYNNIEKISSEISNLNQLKVLDLSSNDLKSFPENLFELKSLEQLSIGLNEGITKIPAGITNLQSLRYLNLFKLDIDTLPDSIIEMNGLKIHKAEGLRDKLPEKFWGLFVQKGG